ncbi:Set1/Ash2 histone methyltransferase complex subunit ASH2 [Carpediemonas membranifera]|uniref:Set1/Ash2 histone methyltransferase complex subunit ASH2 n=1 Tax=Carpediemonas membranifera TaxID=201153 RepID=A0A8J6C144_9EUKA|nr:Set1/Ash2 histone methyltransferase complex subunit ASH2 [Carpediemonas membranifera]|eukprot:KAG9397206.1 Set1/Ash2 histone methyltransferase complex subunit ASH2 [Carpediemonas membranifera]
MVGRKSRKPDFTRNWVYEASKKNKDHVVISNVNRSRFTGLSDDQLTYSAPQGYRIATSTHGAQEGTWYFEASCLKGAHESPAFRIGWARHDLPPDVMDANVGYDVHSWGIRSVDGSTIHDGHREAYGKPFGPGDVLGCLIHLPPCDVELEPEVEQVFAPNLFQLNREPRKKGSKGSSKRGKQKEASRVQHRSKETEQAAAGVVCTGSYMQFFLNGEDLGKTFTDLPGARYYPAISAYNYGKITAAFERDSMKFADTIPSDIHWRPINDLHAIRHKFEMELLEAEQRQMEEEQRLKEEQQRQAAAQLDGLQTAMAQDLDATAPVGVTMGDIAGTATDSDSSSPVPGEGGSRVSEEGSAESGGAETVLRKAEGEAVLEMKRVAA